MGEKWRVQKYSFMFSVQHTKESSCGQNYSHVNLWRANSKDGLFDVLHYFY